MTHLRHLLSLFAIAIFVALVAMPGSAFAHAGHSHAAPIAVDAATDISADATVTAASENAQEASAYVAPMRTPSDDRGCVGGCCGSTAGMACCSVVLTPAPVEEPALQRSSIFEIIDYRPAHGLTPEALPKPPKSLA